MPARDDDPIVEALQAFTKRLGLADDSTERILQFVEGARYSRVRQRYAERTATGWRRTYTKAQKKVRAANKRKNRAAAKAAQRAHLQSLKKAA